MNLSQVFKKYTGALRSYKVVYVINNILQRKKLRKNKALYKKYNIRKSIYSPIGAKDFPDDGGDKPWLDMADAKSKLKSHPNYGHFSNEIQQKIMGFIDNGFMVLESFFDSDQTEMWDDEINALKSSGRVSVNYGGRKIMDAHQASTYIDQTLFRNQELLQLLDFIMGKKVIPFQSIHFQEGSEQKAHSDAIHMATYPEGYLIAAWIAMEDIDDNNGPVFYYPGSHKLPYLQCEDFSAGNSYFKIGSKSYENYEKKIAQTLEQSNFSKSYFHAKKGDVLIWHGNLIHGGSPIKDESRTRKSMVAHFYCKDVICYHEITQRPAIIAD